MNRNTRKPLIALMLVGLLLVLVGLGLAGRSAWFKATAERAEGTIVRVESTERGGRKRKIRYRPIFTFVDRTGRKIETGTWTSSNTLGHYSPGQPVPVLYRANDPEGATIDSFRTLWLAPLLSLAVGFAFVVLPPVLVRKH